MLLAQVLVAQLKLKEENLRSQIKELHQELAAKEERVAKMEEELKKAEKDK